MRNIKIFILDDDEIGNELSRTLLHMSGIDDVTFRFSGRESIKYLDECLHTENFPDMILVDLNLPGMDGFAFIENYDINYRNYYPGTGVIMLTNSIVAEDKFTALKNNSILDFWSKPLTKMHVCELIRHHRRLTHT